MRMEKLKSAGSMRQLPDAANASTMKLYEEIVRFADEFLNGGTYDLHVNAYANSPVVRISIESPSENNSK